MHSKIALGRDSASNCQGVGDHLFGQFSHVLIFKRLPVQYWSCVHSNTAL